MILIIGSDNDDIAYIVKTMTVDRTDIVAGKYEVTVGCYADREVVVAASGYGEEMATLIAGLLIERYRPYIVLAVGSVTSVDPGLKRDELFLATRVYAMDVNLTGLGQYKYGQIPEQPAFFVTDSDLRQKILASISIAKNRRIVEGILLSGNTFYHDLDEFKKIQQEHFVKVTPVLATDTETSGFCCAAALFGVPILVLKGCSYELAEPSQKTARTRTAIMLSPVIGKLLLALLNTLA